MQRIQEFGQSEDKYQRYFGKRPATEREIPQIGKDTWTYSAPFSREIMIRTVPEHIKLPTVKYDGTTDPEDHLIKFEMHLDLYNASGAIRCKFFPITLSGIAFKWYKGYSSPLFTSWEQLATEFVRRFSIFKDPVISPEILFSIKQGPDETLKEYLRKMETEILRVGNITEGDKLLMLRAGLRSGTSLWSDLYLQACADLKEFNTMATKRIRQEETEGKRQQCQKDKNTKPWKGHLKKSIMTGPRTLKR